MPEDSLTISSTSDTADAVQTVAQGEEARSEPQFVAEELPGVSREHSNGEPGRPVRSVSFEHPASSRIRVQQALDEAENELSESTEKVVSNELSEGQDEPEPDNIDLEAVRQAATADAIAEGRRRNAYYQEQANQHFSNPQAEIEKLRAEHHPALDARLKVLIPDDDPALRESASIPLSADPQIALRLADSFATLPGGVEAAAYVMRNPDEKRKLAALPEHLAQVRIAQLANRLDPSLHRRPSQAPPPHKPLTGHPTKFQKSPEDMTYQEYRTFRDKQEKARYRR